jgi:hypothetical protein
MQSPSHAPDLAGLIHGGLVYGNIAVKAPPIRLSAFAPLGKAELFQLVPADGSESRAKTPIAAHKARGLTALPLADIARLHAIGHRARIGFPWRLFGNPSGNAAKGRSRAHTGNK